MLNSICTIQKPYEISNMERIYNSPVKPTQSFNEILGAITSVNDVISELESLGVHVTVRAVPNNPESLRSHANTVSSFGSVTIAPNILEDMVNDSETRQKYVTKIESWLNRGAEHAARVSAMGGRIVHRSMVIHEDGSVTYNSMIVCDPSDEDDDTCETVENDIVNFYNNLDNEGVGQHFVTVNIPIDRNSHLITAPFANGIPHEPNPSRNRHRQAPVGFQIEALFAGGMFADSSTDGAIHMAGTMLSDSRIRQYQQSLK